MVGSILELAKLTDTPAPSIRRFYACVKLLNKVMLTEGGVGGETMRCGAGTAE